MACSSSAEEVKVNVEPLVDPLVQHVILVADFLSANTIFHSLHLGLNFVILQINDDRKAYRSSILICAAYEQ